MTALPSFTALQCLDAAARLGSFTRAATEVHLTQGAVSHQILGMEAQLGVALFLRQRTGLQLTAAGRAYWTEVSAALRQIERATQNLAMHKGHGGALNLCVASSFSTYWLIPRLSGFVAAHPEVTLNLSTHIGPVDFGSTSHDAAIEYCDGASGNVQARRVMPLTLQPYAAPALLPADRKAAGSLAALLNTKPLIRHTTVPNAWPQWLACAGLAGRVDETRLGRGPQYDLLSMALNGAIAGLGVALLPDYVAQGALRSGQLARLSERSWTSDKAYYLRYPDWKAELAPLHSFREWLRLTSTP